MEILFHPIMSFFLLLSSDNEPHFYANVNLRRQTTQKQYCFMNTFIHNIYYYSIIQNQYTVISPTSTCTNLFRVSDSLFLIVSM